MFEKYSNHISIGIGLFGIIFTVIQLLLPDFIGRTIIIVLISIFALIVLGYGARLLLNKLIGYISHEIYRQDDLINFFGILGNFLYKQEWPHIMVRIKTMQIIFEHIVSNVATDDAKLILKNLGREIARDLINANWKDWIKVVPGTDQSPQDTIQKWSNLETTAGWGKFEITFTNMNDKKFRGDIKVHSCFLAFNRNKDSRNLCSFLIGYFEVIISDLAGFDVEVKEHNCGKDSGDGTCDFTFKPR
jgi:predicted hydrocarbon binding protein